MTDSYANDDEQSDDVRAAEYVLGTVTGEEREVLSKRVRNDPAFARLVEKWEIHFEPLGADYEEIKPPARVRAALDKALFDQSRTNAETSRPGLLQSLAFWRFLTASAIAVAILLVATPMLRTPLIQPTPLAQSGLRFVASLRHDQTDVHYFAIYNSDERKVALNHVSGARADGHDFVLWVSSGDRPPIKIGVVPVGGTVSIPAKTIAKLKIGAGANFMITLEPHEPAADSAPRGPMVATGDLRRI